MEEKKKFSLIKFIFNIFKYGIFIILPGIKLLSMDGKLKRVQKISKKKYFLYQRLLNVFLAIVLTVPLFLTYEKSLRLIDNQPYLSKITNSKEYKSAFLVNKQKIILSKISINKGDSLALKNTKTEAKARYFAKIFIWASLIIFNLFNFIVVMWLHPILDSTKKLQKILISNGVIKKEELSSSVVLATPMGFLISISGSTPKEIATSDRIWAALNVRVSKDKWMEDPDERTTVFFEKSFELPEKIIYDKIK